MLSKFCKCIFQTFCKTDIVPDLAHALRFGEGIMNGTFLKIWSWKNGPCINQILPFYNFSYDVKVSWWRLVYYSLAIVILTLMKLVQYEIDNS